MVVILAAGKTSYDRTLTCVSYADEFQEFSNARYRSLALTLVYLPTEIVLLVGHLQPHASSVTYVVCSRPGKYYKLSLGEQPGGGALVYGSSW